MLLEHIPFYKQVWFKLGFVLLGLIASTSGMLIGVIKGEFWWVIVNLLFVVLNTFGFTNELARLFQISGRMK